MLKYGGSAVLLVLAVLGGSVPVQQGPVVSEVCTGSVSDWTWEENDVLELGEGVV